MTVILSAHWSQHTAAVVSVVPKDSRYLWVANILDKAVAEELDHARRRKDEPRQTLSSYDKSYTRKYTEYTRDNPMYEMTDYTAYLP
jgi:hypothetical protein